MLEGERLWTGWATDTTKRNVAHCIEWNIEVSIIELSISSEKIKIYDTIFLSDDDENWVKSERWKL